MIEFLLRTPWIDRRRLGIALNWRGQVTLVQAHQMGHDPRLVAQNRLNFTRWLIILL